MNTDQPMRAELAGVLADPTFVRSPVLARLLGYLVETTIDGKGKSLKSFAVAVDGLGRDVDLDPQADTYARVQVARLRKALDSFYASSGAGRTDRLAIDSGSYEVRLMPNGNALAAPLSGPKFRGSRPVLLAIVVAAVVAAAGALSWHWRQESQQALARWQRPNFPTVSVRINGEPSRQQRNFAEMLRQDLLIRIDRYQGVRVVYESVGRSDYAVEINMHSRGDGVVANTFVIDRENNRSVWSGSETLSDETLKAGADDAFVSTLAFVIANGAGVLHINERSKHHPTGTPYGCWLRFARQLKNNHLVRDDVLDECAAAWHAATPDSSVGSGLYGWVLLNQAIVAISDSSRAALIDQAVETLESARALNPTSGFVRALLTRAYAMAGEDAAMRNAAKEALTLNLGNLEIEGFVGTMLAFRDDPQGEVLVDHAIARHPSPPPWYFIAKFVSAMMRNDAKGAGEALTRLETLNHSLPIVAVFTAAYQAHTGKVGQARASWERAKRAQPVLHVDPDLFLRRTPLAPSVQTRLKQWLAPVLK